MRATFSIWSGFWPATDDNVVDDDDNYDGCNAVPGSGARSNYCSLSLVHVGATSSVHKLFGWSVHKKALSCIMMWSRLVKLLWGIQSRGLGGLGVTMGVGGTTGDPEGGGGCDWVGPRPEGLRRGCTLLLWALPATLTFTFHKSNQYYHVHQCHHYQCFDDGVIVISLLNNFT